MTDRAPSFAELDFSQPHVSRVYDYLLGGKDNFAADRAVGDELIASLPTVQLGVLAQRATLGRVVRYLVANAGVRQLIDVGSGLPTADNVHQIAQRLNRGTRVIYVDNDPIVLTHARALLADDVATIAVEGDLRRPADILNNPDVRGHLDWDQPIGLLLCGILHHLLDSERPLDITSALVDALPPGSYLFIHHLIESDDPAAAGVQAVLRSSLGRGQFRTWEQVRSLFAGLELVDPGLVNVSEWRPDPDTPRADDNPVLRLACAGVGYKPLSFKLTF